MFSSYGYHDNISVTKTSLHGYHDNISVTRASRHGYYDNISVTRLHHMVTMTSTLGYQDFMSHDMVIMAMSRLPGLHHMVTMTLSLS